VSVTGGLVYGGTLVVRANGALNPFPPLTVKAGSSYVLFANSFNSGPLSATGAFSHLDLPNLTPGFRWNTSRLTVNGTIFVEYDVPNLNPVAFTNGTLVVQFQTYQGLHYVLEATSSLDPPAPWLPLYSRTGTGTPTTFYLPVNSASPARFFRVRMN
jgi:hypothetical protein